MIWGSEGNSYEDILKPLGLCTSGGRSNPKNGKMTYMIYNISDGKLFCELDFDKIKDIYSYIPVYQRKDKILKIKKRINDNIKI